MNYENEYEKEIDLKDLIFYVLQKWRQLILAAVLLGIALGGYKVASGLAVRSDSEAYQKLEEQYTEDQEDYERALASGEREVELLQAAIKAQETYLDESILMKLDAYAKPEASADFFVKLDNEEWDNLPIAAPLDPTDSIVRVYTSNLTRCVDWEELSEETGRGIVYLKEVTSIALDYSSNTFTITVAEETEEAAAALLSEIIRQLQDRHDEIAKEVGGHTLVLVNESVGTRVDQSLSDTQKKNRDLIATYQKSLTDKEKALDELKEPEVPSAYSNRQMLKTGIKFGVIGAFAGVFLVAFFWAMLYVLSGKLRTEDEMKSAYGIPVLGVFSEQPKTGAFSGIDRLLQKLGGKLHSLSDEVVLSRAAVTLHNLYSDGGKLLVTGSIAKEQLQSVASGLEAQLSGVELICGENIAQSLQTLKLVPECDGVLLVEQRGVSSCSTIEQEKELAESLGKKIVGCIIL